MVGYFHAKLGRENNPIWPVKFLVTWLIGGHSTRKEMVEKELNRKDYSFREHYIAATVVWFTIGIFLMLLILVMSSIFK